MKIRWKCPMTLTIPDSKPFIQLFKDMNCIIGRAILEEDIFNQEEAN